MGLRGPVLVATDLSEGSDAALRQGLALAGDLRAPCTVCHVLPEFYRVRMLFPQDAGVDEGLQRELEQKSEAAVRSRLENAVGGQTAAVQIETGSPHAGILSIADRLQAGVIVVGPGATALRVARAAVCPVLVARQSPSDGAVLGATDFSDPALPAVRMAADEARRRQARLRLVHCLDIDAATVATAALPGAIYMPMPLGAAERLEEAARARLKDALSTVAGSDLACDALVIRQPPALGIVEAAQSVVASLVVVGTRGRTSLARLVLGSVAERVLAHASCSVLLVPLGD